MRTNESEDEDSLKGFGIFAGEEGDAFAAGVEEVRERTDRDFRERAKRLFEE